MRGRDKWGGRAVPKRTGWLQRGQLTVVLLPVTSPAIDLERWMRGCIGLSVELRLCLVLPLVVVLLIDARRNDPTLQAEVG